jgi:DNA-damage-inducible protein D
MNNKISLFEGKKIRRHYDSETEIWYFSLVDIVFALTDSANATDYLKKIRKRDQELDSFIGTNCPQVLMKTERGKNRKTLSGTKNNNAYEILYEMEIQILEALVLKKD